MRAVPFDNVFAQLTEVQLSAAVQLG